MNHFLIFGSYPTLGLAEFSALYPTIRTISVGSGALLDDPTWNGEALMKQLGGTVKLGDLIGTIPLNSADGEKLAEIIAPFLASTSIDFGCTLFGAKKSTTKLPIQLKKALKARGISSRWVTGKDGGSIAPAAISKMHLTTEGIDICLFVEGTRLLVGRTTHVQNADAWSHRDYGRPKRDELVGMLPPKLARMMVNLARMKKNGTLFDPFCGGGTVLMEAALATSAKQILGTDIDKTQITNARENTAWLRSQHIVKDVSHIKIEVADARTVGKRFEDGTIDAVVTEGTLGPALRGRETAKDLQKNASEISRIWQDTLRSLKPTLSKNARVVGVWPSFRTASGMARVELSEAELHTAGFELEETPLLIYHRPGQYVMRRIVILKPLH
ncbi:methyltransferase domain-containing protein [Patescibacteria group bacterium]|nr:methyltransferase domain-containing protein [Patescibacteria group bacterium]